MALGSGPCPMAQRKPVGLWGLFPTPSRQDATKALHAAATGIFNNGSDFCMMNEALPLCT
jgi:hypothetical protein